MKQIYRCINKAKKWKLKDNIEVGKIISMITDY